MQSHGSVEQGKSKTYPITFRLSEKLVDELRKVSADSKVSLNTLVGQIFNEYLDWHVNAAKAGFIPVRRKLVSEMIEKLSDEDIMHMAEYMAKKEIKDVILLLRNEYNITSVLDVLETWLKVSGYTYIYKDSNGTRSYVIQHDMGKKWSFYIASLFKFLAQELEVKKSEFDFTENTVALNIGIQNGEA